MKQALVLVRAVVLHNFGWKLLSLAIASHHSHLRPKQKIATSVAGGWLNALCRKLPIIAAPGVSVPLYPSNPK